jgi:hypothetical protein
MDNKKQIKVVFFDKELFLILPTAVFHRAEKYSAQQAIKIKQYKRYYHGH